MASSGLQRRRGLEIRTRRAKRRERVGADRVEAELRGHPFSFPPVSIASRQRPSSIAKRALARAPVPRSRGRPSAHELDGAPGMCVDRASPVLNAISASMVSASAAVSGSPRRDVADASTEAIDSLGIRESAVSALPSPKSNKPRSSAPPTSRARR